jgi:hypothetical protein
MRYFHYVLASIRRAFIIVLYSGMAPFKYLLASLQASY